MSLSPTTYKCGRGTYMFKCNACDQQIAFCDGYEYFLVHEKGHAEHIDDWLCKECGDTRLKEEAQKDNETLKKRILNAAIASPDTKAMLRKVFPELFPVERKKKLLTFTGITQTIRCEEGVKLRPRTGGVLTDSGIFLPSCVFLVVGSFSKSHKIAWRIETEENGGAQTLVGEYEVEE